MAASILLSECLEKVFLNLLYENFPDDTCTYNKDLYNCTLVSRHWCRISTPYLYAYPFHHLVYTDSHITTFLKLIRTLLCCIPKYEIEQIISSNSFNIQKLFSRSNKKSSSSDIVTTFNYITFVRGLIFNETLFDPFKLYSYRKVWLPPYLPKIHTSQRRFSKISIPIINHLLKSLCRYCNHLTKLEFTIRDNEFFNNIIGSLTAKDCNGNSKLNQLKELYYISRYGSMSSTKDLYSSFSNSICNLNLLCNEGVDTIEMVNSLSQFISSQKNLRHVILSERSDRFMWGYNYYSTVFNSLSTQSESLRILEFMNLIFNDLDEGALNSLCLLKNIRELKLYNCKEINNLQPWARSLTNLEVFEFVTYYLPDSEEFLIQLIQSSLSTLTKLIINYKRPRDCQLFQVFQQIQPPLIHLELPKILPSELISIFKSCTQLTYFSTILTGGEVWEEDLKNLGKFIPKNLQKIQFLDMDRFLFSSKSLRCFFKDCVNEGNLKCLEVKGKFNFGPNYFNVAKEFDVQLIKKRTSIS